MFSSESAHPTAEDIRLEELGNERRRLKEMLARCMETAGIRSNVANPEAITRAVESVRGETLDRLRATGWDDKTIVREVVYVQRRRKEFRHTYPPPPPTRFVQIERMVPGVVYTNRGLEREPGVVYSYGP